MSANKLKKGFYFNFIYSFKIQVRKIQEMVNFHQRNRTSLTFLIKGNFFTRKKMKGKEAKNLGMKEIH